MRLWCHQVITWTNVDFSLARFCVIYLRAISQRASMLLFCIIIKKIILSKVLPWSLNMQLLNVSDHGIVSLTSGHCVLCPSHCPYLPKSLPLSPQPDIVRSVSVVHNILIWPCSPLYYRVIKPPGPWFNIKKSSYQYRKSHCGDKTILRPSYLHNGISCTGKISSLYWIRAQSA